MDPTILHLMALLAQYGYVMLFILVFIEGPIASIVGGILAATGVLGVVPVFFAILISNMLSDVVYYAFGRYGGGSFIKRFGHHWGITEGHTEALKKHAHAHGGKTIMLAKLQIMGPLPTGIALLVALGAGKMPLTAYLWYNLLGTIAQTILLEGIGYVAGGWIMVVSKGTIDLTMAVLSFITLGGGIWWWMYYHKQETQKKN